MNKILVVTFANRSFPYDKNMFGQLSRLKFLLNDQSMDNFDKIILMSSKGFNLTESQYPHIKDKIQLVKTLKPSINLFAYIRGILRFAKKNDDITLVSFLPDSEQVGLMGTLLLKLLSFKIHYYIGLFCTADEYLINFEFKNWFFAKTLRGNAYTFYRILRVWLMHFFMFVFNNIPSAGFVTFITNSTLTYNSFIKTNYFKQNRENFVIINSGCDTEIYNKHFTNNDPKKICFANRFTGLKGEEIMKNFLESDYIKNSDYKIYITFYTNNNNTTRLIKYLYEAQDKINLKNIVIYQDISKFVEQREMIVEQIDSDISKLLPIYRDFFNQNFTVELLEKTIFKTCGFFLRPSLYDSQPVSIIEAMQCGCIPIISNRCGLPTNIALPDYQVFNIPENVKLHNKYINNLYQSEYKLVTTDLINKLDCCINNYSEIIKTEYDLANLDNICMNNRYLDLITKKQGSKVVHQMNLFQDTHQSNI